MICPVAVLGSRCMLRLTKMPSGGRRQTDKSGEPAVVIMSVQDFINAVAPAPLAAEVLGGCKEARTGQA
jgi:hypothetical protein